MTEPGACTPCPSSAVCKGGTNIGPSPGYWRRSNTTENFLKCENGAACIGMVEPDNDPKGSCATGYQGIMCTDCEVGFSKINPYECEKCPPQAINALRLAGIATGVILLVVFLVRSTLNGAVQRKNVNSVYMKIMMNHLQLIMLTASFNFGWPENVKLIFRTTEPLVEFSQQLLSFDCFIDNRGKHSG